MKVIKVCFVLCFILGLVGCKQAETYLIVNNYLTETSYLYTYEPSIKKFAKDKPLDVYFSEVVRATDDSVIAVVDKKLVNYQLKDHTQEELANLVNYYDTNTYLSKFYLSPDGQFLFFEKAVLVDGYEHARYQIYSYNLETEELVQWTNDDDYSFFSPVSTESGLFVLRNQEGYYKDAPKDLYFLECPVCTPTLVNADEISAYRIFNHYNQMVYLKAEQSGGISVMATVSSETGAVEKIDIEDVHAFSAEPGVLLIHEGNNRYLGKNYETGETVLEVELEKGLSIVGMFLQNSKDEVR